MTIDELIAHWEAARFETKGATVNIPYGATRKALLGLRNAIVPILNTASPSLAKANHCTVHNQLIGELRAALQADYVHSATAADRCGKSSAGQHWYAVKLLAPGETPYCTECGQASLAHSAGGKP